MIGGEGPFRTVSAGISSNPSTLVKSKGWCGFSVASTTSRPGRCANGEALPIVQASALQRACTTVPTHFAAAYTSGRKMSTQTLVSSGTRCFRRVRGGTGGPTVISQLSGGCWRSGQGNVFFLMFRPDYQYRTVRLPDNPLGHASEDHSTHT